ncbi:uromodulin-like [Clavelina lepadiformis]|uniref:ZP domain-containing protein n=1 Tax=Clavelina lepadiformis TaxID=159417 RepID=A0ABP0FZ10_CLALP
MLTGKSLAVFVLLRLAVEEVVATSKEEIQLQIGSFLAEDNSTEYELLTEGVKVMCLPEYMCVAISRTFYQDRGIHYANFTSLSFSESCDDDLVSDPTAADDHKILCTTKGFMTCGSTMNLTATDVIYGNSLVTSDLADPAFPNVRVGQYYNYVLPFDCAYPLAYLVSLTKESIDKEFHYLPTISQVRRIVIDTDVSATGFGEFSVGMFLFKGPSFSELRTRPPRLKMHETLYVGVRLLEGPPTAVIEVEKCWATPVEDAKHHQFFFLKYYCPVTDFVQIENPKNLSHFYWSSRVFRFSNSSAVYLHCDVTVCFTDHQSCITKCPSRSRRRRSLDAQKNSSKNNATLTVGPIYLDDDASIIDGITDEESGDRSLEDGDTEVNKKHRYLEISWLAVIGMIFLSFLALLIIIAICLLRKMHRIF